MSALRELELDRLIRECKLLDAKLTPKERIRIISELCDELLREREKNERYIRELENEKDALKYEALAREAYRHEAKKQADDHRKEIETIKQEHDLELAKTMRRFNAEINELKAKLYDYMTAPQPILARGA